MYLKPMMAAPETSSSVKGHQYPLYASVKLDGFRTTVQGGQFMSRTLKPVPNQYLQSLVRSWMERLDGELVVGCPSDEHAFNRTQSSLLSAQGKPDVRFYVFDRITEARSYVPYTGAVAGKMSYGDRYAALMKDYMRNVESPDNCVTIVTQHRARDERHLIAMQSSAISHGYGGITARKIKAPYKHGRCTRLEGYVVNLTRAEESEAEIIGYSQYLRNDNPSSHDKSIGRTVRSGHASGKIKLDRLGAIEVRDIITGIEFSIGVGFTEDDRREIWAARQQITGDIVRYKYSNSGRYGKPRNAVFIGFRDSVAR